MITTVVRERVRHPLVIRRLTVGRVSDVAPRIRRLTLVGPELDGFAAEGPDDHIKFFVPDPATGELRAPVMTPEGIRRPEGAIVRDYTPRAVRPGEVDVDVVLHDDAGPVSGFAATARPGDAVAIGGPRGSALAPAGVDHLLLGADESALPALARWLEALPGVRADVVLATDGPGSEAYLDGLLGPDSTLTVLTGDQPGDALAGALDVVRGLTPRPGRGYAWFAGEGTALVPVRRWLRHESTFDRNEVKVDGYWKRGIVALDHHAPLDPEDP